MQKIRKISSYIIWGLCFLSLITGSILAWGQESTPGPSSAGEIWFVPEHKTHKILDLIFIDEGIPPMPTFPLHLIGPFTFTNEVHLNSGDQVFASFAMTITFDSSVAIVNTSEGAGVVAGNDNLVVAVITDNPGEIVVSGFDATGSGPSSDLHILTIHWLAQTYDGTTTLHIDTNSLELEDNTGNEIGNPTARDGSITIVTIYCELGDMNGDGTVDIIDALLVAQYYVGIWNPPDGFDLECADVNYSGTVDIIDALRIAQYYVGIITNF